MIIKENIDIVIFNNELSPIQFKNLEEKFQKEVIDRTGLILQIFSDRAKTREAKLQVDVAKLEYMLPRLSHMHSELGRQGGGLFPTATLRFRNGQGDEDTPSAHHDQWFGGVA